MSVVLASASPQRKAILEQLQIPFRIVVCDVDEIAQGDPVAVAQENSRRKAHAGAAHANPDDLVIGVDTLVELDGKIFGKPTTRAAASHMLRSLSGAEHRVHGGLTATLGGNERSLVATTRVTFRHIDDGLLDHYLNSSEWQGRAGGYAIQGLGAAFVEHIAGDYLNIVGFPVAAWLNQIESWPEARAHVRHAL